MRVCGIREQPIFRARRGSVAGAARPFLKCCSAHFSLNSGVPAHAHSRVSARTHDDKAGPRLPFPTDLSPGVHSAVPAPVTLAAPRERDGNTDPGAPAPDPG